MLDGLQVRERRGEDVTVAGPFRAVLRAEPTLRDERLEFVLRAMGTLGAQGRSVLDIHLS